MNTSCIKRVDKNVQNLTSPLSMFTTTSICHQQNGIKAITNFNYPHCNIKNSAHQTVAVVARTVVHDPVIGSRVKISDF